MNTETGKLYDLSIAEQAAQAQQDRGRKVAITPTEYQALQGVPEEHRPEVLALSRFVKSRLEMRAPCGLAERNAFRLGFKEGRLSQVTIEVDAFLEFLERKNQWSDVTFGPGKRTEGLCKHIEKELAEIRRDPDTLEEWIDVILLALDGAHRAGHSPEAVWGGLVAKQIINERRKWPIPGSQDEPVEHERG